MIDLDKFKGKTLEGETLTQIAAAVKELTDRVDAAETKARTAQKESIDGRKTLKAERDAAFEKLGVDTMDELQALPDAKGQADAVKQVETKLKKAERERDEANTKLAEVSNQHTAMRRDAALAEGIEGLNFRNPGDVRALLGQRIVQEGDAFLFKADDGKLIPIKEGATAFAKTRPEYLHPSDAGGQGSGFQGTGGGGGGKAGDFGGDKAAREAAIAAKYGLPLK